ncbi:MAG: phosphatase PAP2 family protein, partial [Bifidobacteriales bacterium]|nr:phosphatase PAP2 family protein [Bifidobacteriales bacterium]
NSAPSGHTILALAVVLALLCVVPRVWRAFVALVGFAFDLSVGCSLVQGGWHRPSDVVMGILIPTGLCLIALAATRGTGMDVPGTRMSSASIQIVSTMMLVAGFLGIIYACYVIWQVSPGLEIGARWTAYGVHCSAVILMASVLSLTLGLVLAMRQITASPLTRMGLVGRPPAPPKND